MRQPETWLLPLAVLLVIAFAGSIVPAPGGATAAPAAAGCNTHEAPGALTTAPALDDVAIEAPGPATRQDGPASARLVARLVARHVASH